MPRFLLFAAALAPTTALAELQFCNNTGTTASVAIGYKDGSDWVSEGWWNVDAGSCKTVVSGDLTKSHYYWHAESSAQAWEHDAYMFCTTDAEFTITGDADCPDRGYDREGFNEVALDGRSDFTVTLAGKNADAGKSAAVTTAPEPAPQQDAGLYSDPVFRQPDNGPGTYGEPYTITGEFQGCWAVAEELECEIRADGWRYVVSELGPTGYPIFDQLNTYDIGTSITFTGDMITYSGDRADVTVREIDAGFAAPQSARTSLNTAELMDHLQGYWSSDDGSGYGWLVEGSELREIYDANISEIYAFEIYPECAASYGQGPVLIGYPEYDPSMGPACFLIVETGQRSLLVQDVVEGRNLSFSFVN